MKIQKALVMNLEVDATDRGVNIGVEVGLEPCIASVLSDDETKKIADIMTEVSNIMNDALVRDLEEATSLKLKQHKKEDIQKLREETYDKLSDEFKERADKLKKDLSKISAPDKKVERLVKELINNILSI